MNPERVDSLPERLRRGAGHLFPAGGTVVAGVSGGADSVALMHLLLASGLVDPERLVVAHFDHGLRPDSVQDATFTAARAQRAGVRLAQTRWSGPQRPGNLQEQAREARRAFLIHTARTHRACRIATGHHRDDQAETLLDRLMRGSGVWGLAAMQEAQPLDDGLQLVRPLLNFRHQELIQWLQWRQLEWREDPSNRNPGFRRNRLRHDALPMLAQVARIDPVPALALSARHLFQARTALEWCLERLWPELDARLHPQSPECLSLAWPGLNPLPSELLRRVLVLSCQRLTPLPHPPGERATEQFIRLIRSPRRRWSMILRRLQIERVADRIVFTPCQGAARELSPRPLEKEPWEMVEFSTWCPYDERRRFTHP
ncbi:MAG: tRNA lysidine(34) synthetase TilS, partial [Magnetococcales bacterium]|nr:tRNA lysidine(34) synthetase TilS [Magnetococcales bacterium]